MTDKREIAVAPRGISRERNDPGGDDAVGATLPVGFRATSDDEGFKLVIKERPKWAAFLSIFALLWNGFMVVWFTIAISSGQWAMALFGLIHGAVGLIVGYLALRGLLNRVELTVCRGALTTQHRPLPWFHPGPIEGDDIDQLFVEEDRSLRVNNRPVVRYALRVLKKSGGTRQLLIVNELQQARYLEREVERAFGVEDRDMPNEA
jgi:hypothetical protein